MGAVVIASHSTSIHNQSTPRGTRARTMRHTTAPSGRGVEAVENLPRPADTHKKHWLLYSAWAKISGSFGVMPTHTSSLIWSIHWLVMRSGHISLK